MKLSKMNFLENIVTKIYTPVGVIEMPSTIKKVEVTGREYKDVDFYLYLENGYKIDITLPVFYALEDMEAQNQRASEMEKKYSRHEGRYIVKDMTIDGCSVNEKGEFNLHFFWTDCYNDKRVYTGETCTVDKGVRGLYLSALHKPKFYF
jgi:hypothetical protein